MLRERLILWMLLPRHLEGGAAQPRLARGYLAEDSHQHLRPHFGITRTALTRTHPHAPPLASGLGWSMLLMMTGWPAAVLHQILALSTATTAHAWFQNHKAMDGGRAEMPGRKDKRTGV